MVKSTESRKFARTTKHLSRIQGIAPNREIPTELLDDHRALEPPDPIPNSVVKRRIADGSVVLHHVRVGHRQAPIRNPDRLAVWGFFFARRKVGQRSFLQARMVRCAHRPIRGVIVVRTVCRCLVALG